MKRLCIYMIYNSRNEIMPYVGYMLQALKKCGIDIAVVCSFSNVQNGFVNAKPYIDKVFFRENIGYDSGAFKDALCDYVGWEKVFAYDELLLVNDSFMGPFFPLNDYLEMMDCLDCDFWGLSGQEAGEFSNPIYEFGAHIHSYFFVFSKKVIQSKIFREFWENYVYPETFRDAVVNYEILLNKVLQTNGFIGTSYTQQCGIRLQRNENPFILFPFELISEKKFPILKKKCLLIRNRGFESALQAITYLRGNTAYPVEWIEEVLDGQFLTPGITQTTDNCLQVFCQKYKKIYIYGNGLCGKNLEHYFRYKKWDFEGFVLSSVPLNEQSNPRVRSIEQLNIDIDTGIIVSVLNKDVAAEILQTIGKRCKREQLFLISECKAIEVPI